MKTALAIFLLILAWTLIYTAFKSSSGDVRMQLRAAFATPQSQTKGRKR